MVSDINQAPIATGIAPANMTRLGDELFFVGEDPVHGAELWKSDGTAEGTVLVKDIFAGSSTSSPRGFTPFNGALYFVAQNQANGVELWKTEYGRGTFLVKDICVGALWSRWT